MTVRELQDEVLRLKKEKGVFILAHSYERQEITEIADVVGDSYRLATSVKGAKEDTVLMCGVRFMAETVKILAPEKRVILSHREAGCPMADGITPAQLSALQAKYPKAVTAAYINTTAKIKAMSAPFPMFKVMPTGGISLKNLAEYAKAPVIAACGGSYMVTADLIDNQKWDEITDLCKKSVAIVKEARNG